MLQALQARLTLLATQAHTRLTEQATGRWGPVDETGGGRNTDEGFHISGGAIAAGVIVTAVGAFVAQKMGALR